MFDKLLLILIGVFLWQVPPVNALGHTMNCLPGNSKLSSNHGCGLASRHPEANIIDDWCSEFGNRILLPASSIGCAGLTKPAFPISVLIIFQSRSDEQVIWSDAHSVVATVTDHEIAWQLAIGEKPSKAMRFLACSVIRSGHAVSVSIFATSPKPAICRFDDSRPEMRFLVTDEASTSAAAILPLLAPVSQKLLLACWTSAENFCNRIGLHGNSLCYCVMRPIVNAPRPQSFYRHCGSEQR